MKNRPGTSSKGFSTPVGRWNGLNVLERKDMILVNRDLFVSIGLLKDEEADHMEQSSDSDIEYFAGIPRTSKTLIEKFDINAEVSAQTEESRKNLETALDEAVFLKSENTSVAKAV